MRVDTFDFHLPPECIAERPASPRESARLLEVADDLTDRTIADFPSLLKPGDVLVFNDTRVLPARLYGRKGEAGIEVLLHKPEGACWRAFARPGKKLKPGDTVHFADGLEAVVQEKLPSGEVLLAFNRQGAALTEALHAQGEVPLPPYINRAADARDKTDYQTVYARGEALSVAAPTAGLHFTEGLLQAIDALGVQRVHVTLHVGAGTFQPVKVEDTEAHVMHSEHATVSQATADIINQAKEREGRVIAVGTTSLRTLESASDVSGRVRAFEGDTDIFITPGYRFKAVDALLTNFHLPKSTLFMLVCALAGRERMQAAYAHAIEKGYRFYSYGDACFIQREKTG